MYGPALPPFGSAFPPVSFPEEGWSLGPVGMLYPELSPVPGKGV